MTKRRFPKPLTHDERKRAFEVSWGKPLVAGAPVPGCDCAECRALRQRRHAPKKQLELEEGR